MNELNKQIDQYLLEQCKEEGEIGYYKRVAEKFGVHPEKVRKRWRQLQDRKPDSINYMYIHPSDSKFPAPEKYTYTTTNDVTTIEYETEEKIETLEDLVKVCNIDLNKFNVESWKAKSYNAWIKNDKGAIESKRLFSVSANLKAKKVDNDKKLQAEEILKTIREESLKYQKQDIVGIRVKPFVMIDNYKVAKDCALEINIPDLHIGKLAWGKETGEDYDINIAIDRYKKAINELISRMNPLSLEKIILPVGNDMINVDNAGNTTTAGTNVSCDTRFGKMFQTAKELLIDTIDKLSHIAPVDVIVIPGNHDTVAMFTLGEVLDAWYHNNKLVNVTNTHTPRKYYQYGSNLIMYTHGHREKLNDLGIICATEQPQLWAATKFRRVHVGHFHHSKQIKFTDVQEYPGFTVKILNSLSSNDAWHAEKGYLSLKGAEAFLYHKDKGLMANYYYLNQS
jgi:transposase-like protein